MKKFFDSFYENKNGDDTHQGICADAAKKDAKQPLQTVPASIDEVCIVNWVARRGLKGPLL